jgi:hypothetical protein
MAVAEKEKKWTVFPPRLPDKKFSHQIRAVLTAHQIKTP